MTVLYHIIRIIEILLTMAAAAKLLTGSFEMRWNGKAAKVLFWGFWVLGTGVIPIANSFFFKCSGLEYIIVCCWAFVVSYLFRKMPVYCALANNLWFWMLLDMARRMVMIIAGNLSEAESMHAYNMDLASIHPLEVSESIVLMGVMLFLIRQERVVLFIKKRKTSIGVIFFVPIIWYVVSDIIVPYDMLVSRKDRRNMMLAALALLLVICYCILYVIYSFWTEEKRTRQLLQLKDDMLEEQIACMKENYELKRKQIHDSMQQNVLLKGYLSQGKIEEACRYLEKLQTGLKETQIKGETGITPIDIMLHYKRKWAESERIRLVTDIEVYFCPMEPNDICILLGNLLDNAIEAAAGLQESQREIRLKMQTINNMFLMSIENPYKGKRKIQEEKYLTTKPGKESHGMGLESSRHIIRKYDGSFQIKDDGSVFKIEAIILNAKRKEVERYERETRAEAVQCGRESVAGTGGS